MNAVTLRVIISGFQHSLQTKSIVSVSIVRQNNKLTCSLNIKINLFFSFFKAPPYFNHKEPTLTCFLFAIG